MIDPNSVPGGSYKIRSFLKEFYNFSPIMFFNQKYSVTKDKKFGKNVMKKMQTEETYRTTGYRELTCKKFKSLKMKCLKE